MAIRDDFDALDAWFRRRTVDIEAAKARREYAAWQNLSAPQDDGAIVGGKGRDILEGGPKGDQLAPAPGRWPKLTGHPGLPAAVAGAVNVITSAPNTHAQVNTGKTRVDISRGSGADLQASAEVPILGRVTASGNLAPPTRRKEVAVANVQGKPTKGVLESFPNRVRLYNDEKGRLLYEVSPGITVRVPKILGGKVKLVPEGIYVIE